MEYGKHNYVEVDTRIPWRACFAYADTPGHLADAVFIRNKLKVRFRGGEYAHEGEPFVICFCSVRRRDVPLFLGSMEELKRKMLLRGHRDYPGFCQRLLAPLNRGATASSQN